jgi:protein SDA1
MDAEVQGDKGKLRHNPNPLSNATSNATKPIGSKGVEALWAVLLTKELWRKGVWNDGKSVSIVSLGCFHPLAKVQSASIHFFLGEDDDGAGSDSESEDEGPNMKALQHQRGIKKKTVSGEKKFAKAGKIAKKVGWTSGMSSGIQC